MEATLDVLGGLQRGGDRSRSGRGPRPLPRTRARRTMIFGGMTTASRVNG